MVENKTGSFLGVALKTMSTTVGKLLFFSVTVYT